MTKRSAGGVVFGGGSALGAAVIGSLASARAPKVYRNIRKPRWAPPGGVFGPVWTTLYAAIGVAGWRLWNRRAGRGVLGLHVTQLALNALWPVTFFAARNRPAALGVVAALDGAVAAEIVLAVRRDRVAAGLLGPYLAWSLFATALTASVGDPSESR